MVVLIDFVFPEVLRTITVDTLAVARGLSAIVLPILVIVLSELLAPYAKAVLVFLSFRNPLPGHRAFSKYGPTDARISMQQLASHVGLLPDDPKDQNAFWYRLYKAVASEISVAESQESFLRFRDMAAMSALLIPISLLVLVCFHASPIAVWGTTVFFVTQYAATGFAACVSGIRFVRNVLAIHSAKRVLIDSSV